MALVVAGLEAGVANRLAPGGLPGGLGSINWGVLCLMVAQGLKQAWALPVMRPDTTPVTSDHSGRRNDIGDHIMFGGLDKEGLTTVFQNIATALEKDSKLNPHKLAQLLTNLPEGDVKTQMNLQLVALYNEIKNNFPVFDVELGEDNNRQMWINFKTGIGYIIDAITANAKDAHLAILFTTLSDMLGRITTNQPLFVPKSPVCGITPLAPPSNTTVPTELLTLIASHCEATPEQATQIGRTMLAMVDAIIQRCGTGPDGTTGSGIDDATVWLASINPQFTKMPILMIEQLMTALSGLDWRSQIGYLSDCLQVLFVPKSPVCDITPLAPPSNTTVPTKLLTLIASHCEATPKQAIQIGLTMLTMAGAIIQRCGNGPYKVTGRPIDDATGWLASINPQLTKMPILMIEQLMTALSGVNWHSQIRYLSECLKEIMKTTTTPPPPTTSTTAAAAALVTAAAAAALTEAITASTSSNSHPDGPAGVWFGIDKIIYIAIAGVVAGVILALLAKSGRAYCCLGTSNNPPIAPSQHHDSGRTSAALVSPTRHPDIPAGTENPLSSVQPVIAVPPHPDPSAPPLSALPSEAVRAVGAAGRERGANPPPSVPPLPALPDESARAVAVAAAGRERGANPPPSVPSLPALPDESARAVAVAAAERARAIADRARAVAEALLAAERAERAAEDAQAAVLALHHAYP